MITKLLKTTLVLLALMTAAYSTSDAQALRLLDMTFSSYQGSYQPISSPDWRVSGRIDDNNYYITLPFTFYYDGYPNTRVYFNSNGFITFYPYRNNYSYYEQYINRTNASVKVMHRDLIAHSGSMSYKVEGQSGKRVMTFQWENYDFYYQYNGNMNFQIKIYETSNMVEMVYGSMNKGTYNFSYSYYWPRVGFSNRDYNGGYINTVPQDNYNFLARYSNKQYNPEILPQPYFGSVRTDQDFSYFQPGLTLKLSSFPSLVRAFPEDGAILERGLVYGDGSDFKPGFEVDNYSGGGGVYVKYRIEGPLPASSPDYQTIYTATVEGSNIDESVPVTQEGISRFTEAKGLAARWTPTNNGDLDLQSNATDIPGGEYLITASLEVPDASYVQDLPDQNFIIALANDLAITRVNSPKDKGSKKYPLTSQIPVSCVVKNIGLNDVSEFTVYVTFKNENGDTIYEDDFHWEDDANPLQTGDFVNVVFTNYRPQIVGEYDVQFYADLESARDDEEINNYAPRSGYDFAFAVAHEIEASAEAVVAPQGDVYVGRPIRPVGTYANNGVSDISDAPGRIVITNENGDEVFISNITIQDIPSGRYNTVNVVFHDDFVPPEAGTYTVCITVNEPNDPIDNNNTFCSTFNVVHAMAGTYTIGTRFAENDRNYMTIQDAVDDIYLKGLTGDVIFEFTDDYYEIGDEFNLQDPAIDMSSMIVGLGEEHTLTFRPAQNRSVTRGGVEIKVVSGTGIGFYMGQNFEPNNAYAPVYVVRDSKVRQFSNFPGYVIFDGGDMKSIKITMDSESDFLAPFYLAQGTSNVTIKNVLIENEGETAYCELPKKMFNSGTSAFMYEEDNRSTDSKTEAYSAGIILRSTVPMDKNDANGYNLDTLANMHNIITGNEIEGFGYGIVSLGNGVLFRQGHAEYVRYYNTQNEISSNVISNVTRAGIFLGYEENSNIHHNRIFNINGNCGGDAAGIIAGGDKETGWNGYNNINLRIHANEIHNISSAYTAYGIKVEQTRIAYQHPVQGQVYFPDTDENMKVYNNVIWGLETSSENADRAGIRLFTTRTDQAIPPLWRYMTPMERTYRSRSDYIYNNTILIGNDGYTTNGIVSGIAVQETYNTRIINNAIALTDNDVSMNNPVYAAITYQGMMPGEEGAVYSDRNAFWYSEGSGASIVRFIETDETANLLEGQYDFNRNDYMYLGQWQVWTGQDMNSIYGDFTQHLTYTGSEPDQKLRIDTYPEPPLGSILNNRGQRLTDVVDFDIDNNVRGPAGQRYDIGAFEFNGRMFITDVEVMNIPQPAAYLANTFNDNAEYIMALDPIEVMARIRNNGNLDLTGHKTYIYIFREQPDGTFPEGQANAELADTIEFNIPQTETIEVTYNFADGAGLEFYPKTYHDLIGHVPHYVVPNRFRWMEENVTPRYKIEIRVEADQNNDNNLMTKIVRFYHPRSDLKFLISNMYADEELEFRSAQEPAPAQTEIAGRLNFDSLNAVIEDLGWSVEPDTPEGKIDVFNRNAWEEKCVDYTWYRTMIWSDGEDTQLGRYPVSDIMNYLDAGTSIEKKNLIIGSQDIVRENRDNAPGLVEDYLRAYYEAPGNPLGMSGMTEDYEVSNDANNVIGHAIGRDLTSQIKSTNFTKYSGDMPPYCALMDVVPQGEGLASPAYYYENHSDSEGNENGNIMGVAGTTIQRNVVLLGVEWRHWQELETIIRASIDYLEKNGGVVVPIELVNFDAKENGGRVNIFWKTASELNSDRFEVEKAVKTKAGISSFSEIAEVQAAGKSDAPVNYGPVVDRDVSYGSIYIYRLKMIDLDGQYKYSGEVEVQIGAGSLWMSSPSPNPAKTDAEIEFSLPQEGSVEIAVFGTNGKKLMTVFSGSLSAGAHKQSLNISNLPSGAYNVVITNGGNMQSRQLRIVR